jgi:hypothetical protein
LIQRFQFIAILGLSGFILCPRLALIPLAFDTWLFAACICAPPFPLRSELSFSFRQLGSPSTSFMWASSIPLLLRNLGINFSCFAVFRFAFVELV